MSGVVRIDLTSFSIIVARPIIMAADLDINLTTSTLSFYTCSFEG
jgi:hypothetical protein